MAIKVVATSIDDVKVIIPDQFQDIRGYFCETFNKRTFANALGVDLDFVQDNCSFSERKGTVRGLHFQSPPFAQAKLVRAVRGAIFDVAVDIRIGSPTYGKYVAVILNSEQGNQMFIPIGFAHGFCTLEQGCELAYKVSDFYSPEHDAGVVWDDVDLNIDWPCSREALVLSEKDQKLPTLKEVKPVFYYKRKGRD